jgi:hypothetical protein
MTDQWYIARDGQTFGPYTPEQVQELSRIQPFLPTDQMLRAGTQEWRPALLIDDLFAPPAPAPEPEPEPVAPAPSSPSFSMDESLAPAPFRPRRNVEAEGKMPVWFWLGPIGGAALLGILTVVIMFTGRSQPVAPVHREPQPRRPLQRPKAEPPPKPRVEVPPAPTDYSVPKVDYTVGLEGAKISLVVDTPTRRAEGYVNAKGKTIYHGKSEVFFADSKKKQGEEWYAVGDRHGPALAWDEDGTKKVEGQYFRGAKQGKWTTFRKDGTVVSEEMWFRGKKLGPSTLYHKNGQKARAVEYKNDRRTGPAKAWDDAGKELTLEATLRADIESVDYDDMIDVLGTPAEVHEAPKAKGTLHIWPMAEDRYLAVWVTQDRTGAYKKHDIRAFGVTREAIDKLKREVR